MHRSYITALSVALAIFAITGTARAADAKCMPKTTAPQSAVSALVDTINGEALTETGRQHPPWAATDYSPLAQWYSRFIVAMGTNDPPSANDQQAAAALIGEVAASPGVLLRTSIWANSTGTTYTEADATRLRGLLCVDTRFLSWPMDRDEESAADPLIHQWLVGIERKSGVEIRDADGFVKLLRADAATGTRESSRPFNVVSALALRTKFDASASAWPQLVSVAYYSSEKVHGVRLDSRSSGISLYLFSGDFYSSKEFHVEESPGGHQADAQWKSIQSQFKPATIALPPVDSALYGRRGFSPTLDGWPSASGFRAYGTTISTNYNLFSGISQTQMLVRERGFQLAALAGIEGSNAPLRMTLDSWPGPYPPAFTLPTSVRYFVVDDHTGVILATGYRGSL